MAVSVSSTLMQNHVAGQPLPAQRALEAVCAADQSPILIALNDAGRLSVTLRTPTQTTGWTQIDLTAQLAGQGGLGSSPTVQCFAARQDSNGAIWLVIAACSGSSKDSKILLSSAIPNSGAPDDWTSLAAGLLPRQVPAGLVFTRLVLGSGDDGRGAPHIVGSAMSGGQMVHYQINPDPDPNASWTCQPIVLPQNATTCLDAVAGIMPGLGRGVYALCALGTLVNLTFTTLPASSDDGPPTKSRQLALPDTYTPTTVASIAALPVQNGQTELYLSGAGLHRYPLSAQSKSNQSPVQIADATWYKNTADLVVGCDGADPSSIDVWALNGADLLVATTGTLSGSDYVWQTPLALANEVTALAAYRIGVSAAEGGFGSAALALGRSDGTLALATKDAITSLWSTRSISLQQPDEVLYLDTYTTRIVVTDEDNIPLGDTAVLLQPSVDVPALVNGQYIALKAAVAKPVVTDSSGVVTIVMETADATAPSYSVTVADNDPIVRDPAYEMKETLRGITSGDQIAYAKRCDGSPLFPDPAAVLVACNVAAPGIQQLMVANDKIEGRPGAHGAHPWVVHDHRTAHAAFHRHQERRRRGEAHPRVRHSVGCHRVDGRFEALTGEAAIAAQPPQAGLDIVAAAGDLISSALSGLVEVGKWFVNELTDGSFQFVIDLGDQILGFFIEVGQQAMAAIDFVLQYTIGITLQDIIDWLGFLFHWDDILQNHRVIAHMLDLVFDYAASTVEEVRDGMHEAFDDIRAMLTDKGRIVIEQTAPEFAAKAEYAPDGQDPASQTPQANWGTQQLSDNIGGTSLQQVNTGDIGTMFQDLTQSEIDTLQNMIDQFQDAILDGFATMDFSGVLEVFLEIVATTIVDTVENVGDVFFDAVAGLVDGFRTLAGARWDIPVITWLYEQVICKNDGSKLTIMDLVALLVAIPATATGKAINGQNLFPADIANAALQAETWDDLIAALAGTPAGADGLPGAEVDSLRMGAVCLMIGGCTRIVAFLAFLGREYGPAAEKDDFNLLKVVCDWATYALSMANMRLVMDARDDSSDRITLDRLITSSQLLIRVRDTYNAWYKYKYGIDSVLKPWLAVAESGFGVWILIAVSWSISLEAGESPPSNGTPDGTPPDMWAAMVSMKTIQNFMTGLYRCFAFGSVLDNGPTKSRITALRAVLLGIRAAAGMTLGGLAIKNEQSDIGG